MPLVLNSNTAATTASLNLSRANEALQKSLARLSSGKRINTPSDDAGGLAVAYKLNSTSQRTEGVMQNIQNALSYLQMQDSSMQTVGKILDRMSELRTMAQDVTKNTSDIANYSKEFIELQGQLQQIKQDTFNGISLFSAGRGSMENTSVIPSLLGAGNALTDNYESVQAQNQFDRYGRTLYTHPGGQTNDGSISLNVVNLEYVLEVGALDDQRYGSVWGGTSTNGATGVNLGNVNGGTVKDNNSNATSGMTASGFVASILGVSVGQFTNAIEKLADARAENGAEQNRALAVLGLLETNLTNLEAAHGRIMDADIALESTRFARHNILVQASAAMTAQANQLSNVALALFA